MDNTTEQRLLRLVEDWRQKAAGPHTHGEFIESSVYQKCSDQLLNVLEDARDNDD